MRQVTKEEAIKLGETDFWKWMSKADIAKFQFNQGFLWMYLSCKVYSERSMD